MENRRAFLRFIASTRCLRACRLSHKDCFPVRLIRQQTPWISLTSKQSRRERFRPHIGATWRQESTEKRR